MSGRGGTLAGLLARRRGIVTAVAAVAVAAAVAGDALLPPVWRASAELAVVMIPAAEAPGREAVLAAQSDLLRSADLHRQVVAAIGANWLYPDLAGEDEALAAFTGDLQVEAVDGRLLRVALHGRDAQRTARALTALIDAYVLRHDQLASAAGDTLAPERRLAEARQNYEEASVRLAASRQDHRGNVIAEQRPLLLRQRIQLDLDFMTASRESEELEGKLNTLREQLVRTPRTIPLSIETERQQILDDAKGKLLELELREQELLGRYKDSSQFVQSVRDEMARVRAFLNNAEATVPSRLRSGANVVYQEVQKEALSAEAALNAVGRRKVALAAQIGGIDRQIADMAAREAEARDIETRAAAARQDMAHWQRQVEAMRAAGDDLHRFAAVNVETPSVVPTTPRHPRPWRDLPLALLVGILAGVGAALLAERFAGRLVTPQAVERRLGVPVLASLAFRP